MNFASNVSKLSLDRDLVVNAQYPPAMCLNLLKRVEAIK